MKYQEQTIQELTLKNRNLQEIVNELNCEINNLKEG